MNTDEALQKLREGFCLWVGAGVDMHLGFAGKANVPSWGGVVKELETAAGIEAAPESVQFSERIERCLEALGRLEFQRQLRERILRPLSAAIGGAAMGQLGKRDLVPGVARELAHLGSLANPIVNFNIETVSSQLIAEPTGHARIKCFAPPMPGATTLRRGSGPTDVVFSRHVYHPHGSLDRSGICVMAQSEYQSMRGTLALQLAVHHAFECKLAIVGMSMEDAYLREQVSLFRSQIDDIFWFRDPNEGISAPVKAWAWANNIKMIEQPWPTFWSSVTAALPAPRSELRLLTTWYRILQESLFECAGRGHTNRAIAALTLDNEIEAGWLDELRWLARIRGEEVTEKMSLTELNNPSKDPHPAMIQIRESFAAARNVDNFCREVSMTGTVWVLWHAKLNIPAHDFHNRTREIWSTEEFARNAINSDSTKDHRPIQIQWTSFQAIWHTDRGDVSINPSKPGAAETLAPASRLVANVEAYRDT